MIFLFWGGSCVSLKDANIYEMGSGAELAPYVETKPREFSRHLSSYPLLSHFIRGLELLLLPPAFQCLVSPPHVKPLTPHHL